MSPDNQVDYNVAPLFTGDKVSNLDHEMLGEITLLTLISDVIGPRAMERTGKCAGVPAPKGKRARAFV